VGKADRPDGVQTSSAGDAQVVPPAVLDAAMGAHVIKVQMEKNILAGQIVSLVGDIQKLTVENAALNQAFDGAMEEANVANANLARQQHEYGTMNAAYKHLNEALAQQQRENAALKTAHDLEARRASELQAENDRLKSTASSVPTPPSSLAGVSVSAVSAPPAASPAGLAVSPHQVKRYVQEETTDVAGVLMLVRTTSIIEIFPAPPQDNPAAAGIAMQAAGPTLGDGASVSTASVKSIQAEDALLITEEFVNLVLQFMVAGTQSQLVSILLKIDPTPSQLLARLIYDLTKNDAPGFIRPTKMDELAMQIAREISQIQLTPAVYDKAAFDKMVSSGDAVAGDFSCIPTGVPELVMIALKDTPYDPRVHSSAFHTAMIHQYFAWGTAAGQTVKNAVAEKVAQDAEAAAGPVHGPAAGTSRRGWLGGFLAGAGA